MRTIIAGSRTFSDEKLLNDTLRPIAASIDEVVSGTAQGADMLGETWAVKHGIPVKCFRPKWLEQGRGAGIIRNQLMADYAEQAIVFWDGKSHGSMNMIEEMKKRNKPVIIVKFEESLSTLK